MTNRKCRWCNGTGVVIGRGYALDHQCECMEFAEENLEHEREREEEEEEYDENNIEQ